MLKITFAAVATALIASTSAFAWETSSTVHTTPVVTYKPKVQVYYATKVVKKPITKYVTKTRIVPTTEVRHGVKTVAKTVKVPKVIYVDKTVYKQLPYEYEVTVPQTQSYKVPVTTYTQEVVKVPKYRKVVDKQVTYKTITTTPKYYTSEVPVKVEYAQPHYVTTFPRVTVLDDW